LFEAKPSVIKRVGRGHFCSNGCKYTSHHTSKQCETCGKKFQICLSESHRKFCSYKCSIPATSHQRRNRISRTCKNCGQPFEARVSEKRVFCSSACKREFYKDCRVTQKCQFCGRDFDMRRHALRTNGNYCSRRCYDYGQSSKPRPKRTIYTPAMLRRFLEWTDEKTCAFPLCQNAQNSSGHKSKWNLCPTHVKRLNTVLSNRRRAAKEVYKENL
jgi:hypothetical protein